MAKFKLDLRKTLRAIANAVQDQNVARLLSGVSVEGGTLAPRKGHGASQKTRRRVRVLGERRALSELVGSVGVRTGALLKDLGRRANAKIGRVSFKIVPSAAVIIRARVFNKGDAHQPARPVSGISAGLMSSAASDVAADARQQIVAALQRRSR